MLCRSLMSFLFFFNDTATTEIYTLSLHDALPISVLLRERSLLPLSRTRASERDQRAGGARDRKSTRLNSSHQIISYAVFCLKKKKRPHPRRLPSLVTATRPPRIPSTAPATHAPRH